VARQFADNATAGQSSLLINLLKCLIENLEYVITLSVISGRQHYLYTVGIR